MIASTDETYRPDPQVTVDGITIDLRRQGSGRPLLFLTGLEGWIRDDEYVGRLANRFDVLVPAHPGFGASELPRHIQTVGDLALFYLSFIEELGLDRVTLVGSSFGGWVAAEIAVRATHRIASLVLVDAFGIRVGGREDRDIADIYAMSQAELAGRFYSDPTRNRRDVTALPDHVLTGIARARETMAMFGWKPYMHNPTLRRWLKRVDVPTLVLWGEHDRVVELPYGRAYAEAIPGARLVTIPDAGHYPHIEQPAAFAREFLAFADETAPRLGKVA